MSMWFAQYLTDFADQAVILPVSILVTAILYGSGWRREAVIWSITVAATLGLMLLLKLSFGACGDVVLGGTITSPSGHAASAGLVYGSMIGYVVERNSPRRFVSIWIALAIAGAVAVSRVVLGAHTIAEASLGATIGVGAAVLMVRGVGRTRTERPSVLVALPVFVLVFLLHGMHLPAEAAIHQFSNHPWLRSLCHARAALPDSWPGREPARPVRT